MSRGGRGCELRGAGAKELDRVYGTVLRTVVCTTRGSESWANDSSGRRGGVAASPWESSPQLAPSATVRQQCAMAKRQGVNDVVNGCMHGANFRPDAEAAGR